MDDTVVKSIEVEDHVNDLSIVLIRLIHVANGQCVKKPRVSGKTEQVFHKTGAKRQKNQRLYAKIKQYA